MQIVSNTSPILNLAIIDKLHLLKNQFSKIIIPEGVFEELKVELKLPGSNLIKQSIQDEWICIKSFTDRKLFSLLNQQLDKGESEAITLALELEEERILIDERNARQIAVSMGLMPTGVIGVLLKAYKKNEISNLEYEIKLLKEKAGFYISEELVKKILDDK